MLFCSVQTGRVRLSPSLSSEVSLACAQKTASPRTHTHIHTHTYMTPFFFEDESHTLQCLLRHGFERVPSEDMRACRSAVVVSAPNDARQGVRVSGVDKESLLHILEVIEEDLHLAMQSRLE